MLWHATQKLENKVDPNVPTWQGWDMALREES